jgi:hypothetical protein
LSIDFQKMLNSHSRDFDEPNDELP